MPLPPWHRSLLSLVDFDAPGAAEMLIAGGFACKVCKEGAEAYEMLCEQLLQESNLLQFLVMPETPAIDEVKKACLSLAHRVREASPPGESTVLVVVHVKLQDGSLARWAAERAMQELASKINAAASGVTTRGAAQRPPLGQQIFDRRFKFPDRSLRNIFDVEVPPCNLAAAANYLRKCMADPLKDLVGFLEGLSRTKITEHVISHGLDVLGSIGLGTEPAECGWCTTLTAAVEAGHPGCVRSCLAQAAQQGSQGETALQLAGGARPPLHVALDRAGLPTRGSAIHKRLATLLLEADADPLQQDHLGRTAFHMAAKWGQTEIVQKLCSLLGSGTEKLRTALNTLDDDGLPALCYAVRHPASYSCAKTLLEHNADANFEKSGKLPIHLAAECGGADMLELLMEHQAALQSRNDFQQTALHLIAASDQLRSDRKVEACQRFLKLCDDSKAAVAAEDIDGWTPVHEAAWLGAEPLLRELLLHASPALLSGEPEAEDDGEASEARRKLAPSPLWLAAAKGSAPSVSLLLEYGASPASLSLIIWDVELVKMEYHQEALGQTLQQAGVMAKPSNTIRFNLKVSKTELRKHFITYLAEFADDDLRWDMKVPQGGKGGIMSNEQLDLFRNAARDVSVRFEERVGALHVVPSGPPAEDGALRPILVYKEKLMPGVRPSHRSVRAQEDRMFRQDVRHRINWVLKNPGQQELFFFTGGYHRLIVHTTAAELGLRTHPRPDIGEHALSVHHPTVGSEPAGKDVEDFMQEDILPKLNSIQPGDILELAAGTSGDKRRHVHEAAEQLSLQHKGIRLGFRREVVVVRKKRAEESDEQAEAALDQEMAAIEARVRPTEGEGDMEANGDDTGGKGKGKAATSKGKGKSHGKDRGNTKGKGKDSHKGDRKGQRDGKGQGKGKGGKGEKPEDKDWEKEVKIRLARMAPGSTLRFDMYGTGLTSFHRHCVHSLVEEKLQPLGWPQSKSHGTEPRRFIEVTRPAENADDLHELLELDPADKLFEETVRQELTNYQEEKVVSFFAFSRELSNWQRIVVRQVAGSMGLEIENNRYGRDIEIGVHSAAGGALEDVPQPTDWPKFEDELVADFGKFRSSSDNSELKLPVWYSKKKRDLAIKVARDHGLLPDVVGDSRDCLRVVVHKPAQADSSPGDTGQPRYVCDECGSGIRGTRHHCQQCDDFDLCAGCFEKLCRGDIDHTAEHDFDELDADVIYASSRTVLRATALSPLHVAAGRGWQKVVEELVAQRVDPNIRDSLGRSPLHLACQRNRVDTVKFLLDARSDPNLKCTRSGRSPLHCVVRIPTKVALPVEVEKHRELLRALLAASADANLQETSGRQERPLHRAVKNDAIDDVRMLLEARADVNAVCKGDATPYQDALRGSRKDLIQDLIDAGADAVSGSIEEVPSLRKSTSSSLAAKMQPAQNHARSSHGSFKVRETNVGKDEAEDEVEREVQEQDRSGLLLQHAIVVGNNDYPNLNPEKEQLKHAIPCAEQASTALGGLGFKVHALMNATREQLGQCLEDLRQEIEACRQLSDMEHEVVFAFAGHGSETTDGKHRFIHLSDTVSLTDSSPKVGVFSEEELKRRLCDVPGVARVLLILDCCRDGGGGIYLAQQRRTMAQENQSEVPALHCQQTNEALPPPNCESAVPSFVDETETGREATLAEAEGSGNAPGCWVVYATDQGTCVVDAEESLVVHLTKAMDRPGQELKANIECATQQVESYVRKKYKGALQKPKVLFGSGAGIRGTWVMKPSLCSHCRRTNKQVAINADIFGRTLRHEGHTECVQAILRHLHQHKSDMHLAGACLSAAIRLGEHKVVHWMVHLHPEMADCHDAQFVGRRLSSQPRSYSNMSASAALASPLVAVAVMAPSGQACLELLLRLRADPARHDSAGWTAWHEAAWKGDCRSLELLQDLGTPSLQECLQKKGVTGLTPLHLAAAHGRIAAVEWLVSKHPWLVNHATPAGYVEREVFIRTGSRRVDMQREAQLLHACGLGSTRRDKKARLRGRGDSKVSQETAPRSSRSQTISEVDDTEENDEVQQLQQEEIEDDAIKQREEDSSSQRSTSSPSQGDEFMQDHLPSSSAAPSAQHDEAIDASSTANVDLASCGGVSPHHLAAAMGHLQCTRMLLDAGADACAEVERGYTALHLCIRKCCGPKLTPATGSDHAGVLDLLLDRRACAAPSSDRIPSAVHCAVNLYSHLHNQEGSFEFVKGIIHKLLKADPSQLNARTWDGGTPLDWAYGRNLDTGRNLVALQEELESLGARHGSQRYLRKDS